MRDLILQLSKSSIYSTKPVGATTFDNSLPSPTSWLAYVTLISMTISALSAFGREFNVDATLSLIKGGRCHETKNSD
jgi:hypothetical protein